MSVIPYPFGAYLLNNPWTNPWTIWLRVFSTQTNRIGGSMVTGNENAIKLICDRRYYFNDDIKHIWNME
jgi:hypothetical protein